MKKKITLKIVSSFLQPITVNIDHLNHRLNTEFSPIFRLCTFTYFSCFSTRATKKNATNIYKINKRENLVMSVFIKFLVYF